MLYLMRALMHGLKALFVGAAQSQPSPYVILTVEYPETPPRNASSVLLLPFDGTRPATQTPQRTRRLPRSNRPQKGA